MSVVWACLEIANPNTCRFSLWFPFDTTPKKGIRKQNSQTCPFRHLALYTSYGFLCWVNEPVVPPCGSEAGSFCQPSTFGAGTLPSSVWKITCSSSICLITVVIFPCWVLEGSYPVTYVAFRARKQMEVFVLLASPLEKWGQYPK